MPNPIGSHRILPSDEIPLDWFDGSSGSRTAFPEQQRHRQSKAQQNENDSNPHHRLIAPAGQEHCNQGGTERGARVLKKWREHNQSSRSVTLGYRAHLKRDPQAPDHAESESQKLLLSF